MKNKLTQLKRQLLLYDIVSNCEYAEYDLILSLIPNMNKKMLQRDLKDLEYAGIVKVSYDRAYKGYKKAEIFMAAIPDSFILSEGFNERRKKHLNKLHRLGVLINNLYTEQPPTWDIDEDDTTIYKNCKDSYFELFPGNTERTMQRDFRILTEIGFTVIYDPSDRCYRMWEQTCLRESFGIYEENGEYLIKTEEVY